MKLNEYRNKKRKNPGTLTPCHSSFSAGIISGPHRGSFAVRDHHLRSNLGIICGPLLGIISGLGIICGRGSFAALHKTHNLRLDQENLNEVLNLNSKYLSGT